MVREAKCTDSNGGHARPLVRYLKNALTLGFFIAVSVLLYRMLRDIEWQRVLNTLLSYDPVTLASAVAITAGSFLVFSSYDLLGRFYTNHHLALRRVLPLAYVCYAFNLNFGALLGGVGMRYRLYSRFGLDVSTITGILSISVIANWTGYMLVAGVLFALDIIDVPVSWKISPLFLQLLGFILLAVSLGYLVACHVSRRRSWHWRSYRITLPHSRLAILQLMLGALNWSLMALLIYILLPGEAFYPIVLAALMMSSIAGVITHIPGGLGVLEAVFVALLSHEIDKSDLLAGLIAYRAIYFLLPLSIALVIYLCMEKAGSARQHDRSCDPPQPGP
ncbi:MAG: lysylphosphatidylglycerol synthase domain-containing protein [Chromatocurvus sp.]